MLGGELFVRSRSGIVPTSLGKRLIPLMARLVQQADEVTSEAAASSGRTLRFGNTEWTPPTLLGAIQASMSGVDVETETLAPAAAADAVRGGALTVAMIPCASTATPDQVRHPDLGTTVILREPIWLAVSRAHPLADLTSVDGARLAALNWIRYSRDHWFHEVEEELLAQLGQHEAGGSHYVHGHHEAMNWVRDTNAAALTPPTGATRDVRLVPIRDSRDIELRLVWLRGAVTRETLRRLVETVRRYYCGYARTISGYWPWIVEHPDDFPELRRFLPLPTPSG